MRDPGNSIKEGSATMTMEWFRDLVIVITGIVVVAMSAFMALILFTSYTRIKSILDSVKATSMTVQETSVCLKAEATKLVQMLALIQGVREGVQVVSKIFEKKGANNV